jgi:glycosyltransferase involved in cell wall biosynthesis
VELLFAESSIKGWGTEQHFAALALAMARRAHRVRCLMSAGSPLEAPLRAAGIPVELARFRGGADPRMLAQLYRRVAQHRPDWLVTNDGRFYWPLVLIARLSGARTALFRHWEGMPRSALTRRYLPRLADRFILVSQFQRELFRSQGIDVGRMPILYNPIDTQQLSPSAEARVRMRAALGLTEGEVAIGYVGRMVRIKGIFTLLEAAAEVLAATPETRLVWVGDGADLSALRGAVEQSAQRTRHIFSHWSADVRAVYAALDIVAVPSIYPDPCPRVPVEAQACGTTVVCSDAGGLRETFAPGVSGLLTPEGDVRALSAALIELVRDPPRRLGMARAGRELAATRFSFGRIAQDFEAILAGPGTAPAAP